LHLQEAIVAEVEAASAMLEVEYKDKTKAFAEKADAEVAQYRIFLI
jgi:hypothetical protein